NPLPYGDPERLIALDYAVPGQNVPSGLTSMSWQLYHQLSDHARTLEGVAAYDTGDITVTGNGDPERIRVSHATPSLAPTLRVSPALGRWFTGDEGVPDGPDVVVLSHGFWVRRYASDRDVLGHRVILNGVSTEVVGVMPPSFAFPEPEIAVWLPARSTRASATFLFLVAGVARLRDSATLADARSEITNLIGALSRVSPNQRGITSTALPLRDSMVGRVADMLWILLASVGLVLLVGCANVANLFLVRSEARQREVAVRRAIGANDSGIARYFLAESALLSIAGAAVGLLLAWGAVRLLALLGPSGLPRLEEVRLDGVVVSFTVALSILATFALAAIPLVRIVPLTVSLHDTGRGQTASRRRHRARQVLMASQIAFALVLLLGFVGIYGVMSYIVGQRTGEIGVRLALGAEPASVAGMIVRQGGAVALVGITLGLSAALAASRLMASLLYGVSPRDPTVFAATTLMLLVVALVACWLPARRAAGLNPLEALRAE